MAYTIPNIHPLDNQKRKIIGFSLPFNNSAVFNPTYNTKDQIRSNLINYFMTNKGERVFNPFFGSNLKKFIFENINNITVDLLLTKIREDIKLYFPNVFLEKLNVNTNEDKNFFNLQIYYSIIKYGISDNINIIIE